MIVLAWAYSAWGQHPWGQAILWGLKPAVTALVIQAVHRLSMRTLKARWLWWVAGLSLLGMLWQVPFPLIVAAAAFTGGYMQKAHALPAPASSHGSSMTEETANAPAWLNDHSTAPAHTHYSHDRVIKKIAIGVGLWVLTLGALALLLGGEHTLTQMGGFFTQAALLTFGGAYAVLPYVTHAAVTQFGWVTAAQMMDGLALGETTPGPLIMVVAFVGFLGGHSQAITGSPLLGGILAACVVTWFTFLPSFVFILAGGPFVESTRQMPALQGPLQAITAAVIGVMVQLAGVFARQTWLPDGWHMLPDFWAFSLTGVAAWLLIKKQRSVYEVLGLCVVVGLLVQALR
jgi:chromate transporter